MDMKDGVIFTIGNISPIRDDDVYGGYRVAISAEFETIHTPLTVDVTTGDVMTPDATSFTFKGICDENLCFDVWAYNIETVLAEKVETILRRSVYNTRPRDYNYVYILYTTQRFDKVLFTEALFATANHRGNTDQLGDIPKSLQIIAASKDLQNMWGRYRKQFAYAQNIEYDMIIAVLTDLLS